MVGSTADGSVPPPAATAGRDAEEGVAPTVVSSTDATTVTAAAAALDDEDDYDNDDEEAIEVDIHDYAPGSDLLDYLIDLARYGDVGGLRGYFESVIAQLRDPSSALATDTVAVAADDGGVDKADSAAAAGDASTGEASRRWHDYRIAVLSQGDDRDCTLLHYAAANGHDAVVRYILSSFISLSSIADDATGTAAGDAATAAKEAERAAAEAVLNRQNDGGNTALHWACLNGSMSCTKLLADPSTQLYPGTGSAAGVAVPIETQSNSQTQGKGKSKSDANGAATSAPQRTGRSGAPIGTDLSIRNAASRTAMDEAEANNREEIVLYLLALEMHREKLAGVYDDAGARASADATKAAGDQAGASAAAATSEADANVDADVNADGEDEVKISAGTM